MQLSHIENVIDGIDPYFLTKDLGFKLLDGQDLEELKDIEDRDKQQKFIYSHLIKFCNGSEELNDPGDYSCIHVNGRWIRLLPFGFLNMAAFKDISKETFIAGTVIDFLAFYMHDDYDKAFTLFFKQYSGVIKDRLAQDPVFVEKLVKENYIKRKNVLNYIVKKLFLNDNFSSDVTACRTWADRHNIQDIKGYAYFDSSKNIYNMLRFFEDGAILDYYEGYHDNKERKVDAKHKFSDFINNYLLTDSDCWVVIPYFSDYYCVSELKFINPNNNFYYSLPLTDAKLSFAGIYQLPPNLNYATTKIRLLESDLDVLTLKSYASKLMEGENLLYLSVSCNNAGINKKSNLFCMGKPLFLYEKNSSLPLLKSLYDSLLNKNAFNCDLYICQYAKFKEDNVAYTFEAFLEKKFKDIVVNTCFDHFGRLQLSKDLKYFLEACDFNNRPFRDRVLRWLKEKNYGAIYSQMNELAQELYEFNKVVVKPTTHGYISSPKNDTRHTKDTALTNFVLKIDQNVIFPDNDDIMHKGRLIMGDAVEFPVTFYKKEICKGKPLAAIEKIALKAYSNAANMDDSILTNYKMPTVFDESCGNMLMTIVRHETTKAPCKYGVVNVGWDKVNSIFNALQWQATTSRTIIRAQNIYTLTAPNLSKAGSIITDIQACYSNLDIPNVEYKTDLSFLNKDIKDIIGVILASIYRTYLGYNVTPVYIEDSMEARNLIRFIFVALGQIKPLELSANIRLLKGRKETEIFSCLNRYPIYARCENNIEHILKHIKDYPMVLFVSKPDAEINKKLINSHIYKVESKLSAETYRSLSVFTRDTLLRFFKWLFKNNGQEFDIKDQICESQKQLIKEGNQLFDFLWWSQLRTR